MTVRILIKAAKIVALAVLLVVMSLVAGVVTVVWSQGAQFRFASSCAAVTGVGAGSFCVQWGTSSLAPSFWWFNGSAWAQNFGSDTTGTPVTLDTLNETAVVALAGQQSAFVVLVPTSAVMTLIPVVSYDNNVSLVESEAVFVDAAGATATSIVDPASTMARRIKSLVGATHAGVKVSARTSGSVVATGRAVDAQPEVAIGGTDGTKAVMARFSELTAGFNAQEMAISHPVPTYGYSMPATSALGALNNAVTINGSGAGQICGEVPSGATMTVSTETRNNAGSWVAAAFRLDTGTSITSSNSFPFRGCFEQSGFEEYRLRVSTYSSGSVTGFLLVSPGAGLVRALQVGAPWAFTQGATATTTDSTLGCYIVTTASTNATLCKNASGNFYGLRAINTTATLAYVRLYNLASSPTCSSATGFIESIPVPASATGAGVIAFAAAPIGYSTGIGACVTGGGSSTDNTNAPAGVYITIPYK